MNLLCIDTSNDNLIVVLKNAYNIFENEKTNSKKHLEVLMPQVDNILSAHGLNFSYIETIGIVTGPGSFTGIRIGVATVKGICKANPNIKCVDVNSLDLMAYTTAKALNVRKPILCVIPSTQSKYYAGYYLGSEKTAPDNLVDLETIKNLLAEEKYILAVPEVCEFINREAIKIKITAKNLIDFTEHLIMQNKAASSKEIKPYYLSLSQAEEALERKNDKAD